MMQPYGDFLVDFEHRYPGWTHANDPQNTRAAVIVETRPDFFLPKVVRNVMFHLGPAWNLYVLTAEATAQWLTPFLPGWRVVVAPIAKGPRLPRDGYNHLLLQEGFWKMFAEEQLLVFQTDSLLCGPNIGDFLDYDLVGAPCGRFDEEYVANGGLSLRRRDLMLDCLGRATPADGEPEDVFFTAGVRALGGKLPDVRTAACFALESIYVEHPVGVHGTDKNFHSLEVARAVVDAVPAAA
jgi:hypothetical protein